MKILKIFGMFALVSLFSLFFSVHVNAYPLSAATDKIVYATNDALTITGTVDTTGSVPIYAIIHDSTGSIIWGIMDAPAADSSGGSPNTFSITTVIESSYTPGDYFLILNSGTDTVNMSIKIVSQLISLEANLINSGNDVINISTNTAVQTANFLGGNFTELLNLSKSTPQKVYYGNYSINGKVYHFVLVDQNNATVYDRLYIDDDTDFRMFNDTEDSGNDVEYQALRKGNMFSNGTFRYIVGEIEKTTGNKIILWQPPTGKPPYSTSDTVNFIIIAKNATHLLSQPMSVDILNSTGQNITPTNIYNTNSFGWSNVSISLSNIPADMYIVSLNDSLGIMPFPVEAFKLFATITDSSDNPTSSFAPNSQARISITSRNASGTMNLTSFNTTIYYSNGSTVPKTKNTWKNL
jgi:hypothetical protein